MKKEKGMRPSLKYQINTAQTLYHHIADAIKELVNNTYKLSLKEMAAAKAASGGADVTFVEKNNSVCITIEDEIGGIKDIKEMLTPGGEHDDGFLHDHSAGGFNAPHWLCKNGGHGFLATRTDEEVENGVYRKITFPITSFDQEPEIVYETDTPYPGNKDKAGTFYFFEVDKELFLDTERIIAPDTKSYQKHTFESNLLFIHEFFQVHLGKLLNTVNVTLRAIDINGVEIVRTRVREIPAPFYIERQMGPNLGHWGKEGHYEYDYLEVVRNGKVERLPGRLVLDFFEKPQRVTNTVYDYKRDKRHQGVSYRYNGYLLLENIISGNNCASYSSPHDTLNGYGVTADWTPATKAGIPATKITKDTIDESDFIIKAIDKRIMSIMPNPEKWLTRYKKDTEVALCAKAAKMLEENGASGTLKKVFKDKVLSTALEVPYYLKRSESFSAKARKKIPTTDMIITDEDGRYAIVEAKVKKKGSEVRRQTEDACRGIYADRGILPSAVYALMPTSEVEFLKEMFEYYNEHPEEVFPTARKSELKRAKIRFEVIEWADLGITAEDLAAKPVKS